MTAQSDQRNVTPLLGRILVACLPYRWIASTFLLITLDITTYFAFKRGGATPWFAHQDKILHGLSFACLFFLGYLALNHDLFRARTRLSALVMSLNGFVWLSYAALVETVQHLLGYRQASCGDLAADVVGMLVGAFLILTLRPFPKPHGLNHEQET